MKKISLCIVLISMLVACNKSEDGINPPTPSDKPVWETHTHASLLKFLGSVQESQTYFEDEGVRFDQLVVRFDAAGHCTYYNATGINSEATTYNFDNEDIWYTYAYDAQGRMSAATRNQVGAVPITYTITYGSHTSYVLAPFPLGNIRPFMLKGVTRIEGTGYLLTSDGKSIASEEITTGWGASTVRTTSTITEGMPTKTQSITLRNGEVITKTAVNYSYQKNWLVEMKTVRNETDGLEDWETIEYSTIWPCSPTVRAVGKEVDPTIRIEYKYAENGLPISAACTLGTPVDFGDVFQQRYNAYDTKGNWTSSTIQVEDMELLQTREVTYY